MMFVEPTQKAEVFTGQGISSAVPNFREETFFYRMRSGNSWALPRSRDVKLATYVTYFFFVFLEAANSFIDKTQNLRDMMRSFKQGHDVISYCRLMSLTKKYHRHFQPGVN